MKHNGTVSSPLALSCLAPCVTPAPAHGGGVARRGPRGEWRGRVSGHQRAQLEAPGRSPAGRSWVGWGCLTAGSVESRDLALGAPFRALTAATRRGRRARSLDCPCRLWCSCDPSGGGAQMLWGWAAGLSLTTEECTGGGGCTIYRGRPTGLRTGTCAVLMTCLPVCAPS